MTAAASPMVASEIGTLRSVLVHRPGIEIARITPDNKDALLFDDLLWLDRAQAEHDEFVGLLRDRGVEVLYFADLLADVLADEEIRGHVIDRAITPAEVGPRVSERLRAALREEAVGDVVDVLLGGLLESELRDRWHIDAPFAGLVADRFHYVLRPLPNLLFMRDNASWINDSLALGVLAWPARARESGYMEIIYGNHPRFREADRTPVYGAPNGDRLPASLEGGDVLVLSPKVVMVGLGERSAPASVEILARRLFERGTVERVLVVHLPPTRSVMHLDTVFTMVDRGTFNVFPGTFDAAAIHVIRPSGRGGLEVERTDGLMPALQAALENPDLVFIPTGGDAIGRVREQWDDGNNTLAIAPGVVVAYGRNQGTNRRLRDAGVDVIELDAFELCRGRGGSRCMTQPLVRDPI